ncbi:MAG: hypothetical protein ACJ786_04725 [Catenulispora sp.]
MPQRLIAAREEDGWLRCKTKARQRPGVGDRLINLKHCGWPDSFGRLTFMTARDEILAALPALRTRLRSEEFAPDDVIDELARRGSRYRPSTIRTHVVSRMCANAPDHHAVTYDDLERVAPGRYRQRS